LSLQVLKSFQASVGSESPSFPLMPLTLSHSGAYIEMRLKTRKSAQTGVLHTWRLWANDADTRLCPVRALVRIACLYGSQVPLKGPLFLRIGKLGDVLRDQPVVGFWDSLISNS
jgi:hypothetical protein